MDTASHTFKIDDDFLAYLRNKAEEAGQNAAYGGRQDDGGCNHTRELICAYTAGRDGLIPTFWINDLNRYHREKDSEYQEYRRLKLKYEGK